MEEYRAYGAVRQLYRIRKWPRGMYQILLEGPAGTGKTRGLCEWVNWMCEEFAGIRVLFLRRTKESLAESVLDTWENHVLGGAAHPAVVGTAGVHHRQYYTYPNGSHIVLGGMKDKTQAEKTFSTQYDIIVFFESREIASVDNWQWLARANRNWKMPWQIRIADTNPGAEFHWLNKYFPTAEEGGAFRFIPKKYHEAPPFTVTCDERHISVIPKPEELEVGDDGKIKLDCPQCGEPARGGSVFRLLSRFQDNPVWYDHDRKTWTPDGLEYVEGNLALLEGAPRANLYEGRWAAEEGVIYEGWDGTKHVIDPEDQPREYKWYLGAFDQGFRHPAVLQVWGVVDDSMWLIYELYRTGMNIDDWAREVLEVHKKYPLGALVCDHDPDYVNKFNDMLGEARGRDGERIARNANKNRNVGIEVMRWALSQRDNGPRLHVVRGYGAGKDPVRVAKMKPASFEEEIGQYIWKVTEQGQPSREEPDPTCADHAMDAARYAAMYLWKKDLSPMSVVPDYEPDTFGKILRHKEVLDGAVPDFLDDILPH